jgi:hypothetical protein
MKKVPVMVLASLCLAAFAAVQVSAANPTWKDAEKGLRGDWAKKYSNEKILKAEQNGSARNYEKIESGVKVSYCDIPAKVTAQQSGGKRVFNVTAIFRKTGGLFRYTGMSVGESEAAAEKGQEAPTKDQIKKLVADLYAKQNPGAKVTKVLLSDPELKKDSSAGRWWYNVGADVYIVDATGKSKKCTNDYTSVYRGEKGQEGVNASGPWQVEFIDDFVCK